MLVCPLQPSHLKCGFAGGNGALASRVDHQLFGLERDPVSQDLNPLVGTSHAVCGRADQPTAAGV
jgi:hypothetical protein